MEIRNETGKKNERLVCLGVSCRNRIFRQLNYDTQSSIPIDERGP